MASQQKSNEVVTKMYQSAENRKSLDQMSKIADLAAKGYDFSDLDSMSSLLITSNSLSAINRLANVLEQQLYEQAWCNE